MCSHSHSCGIGRSPLSLAVYTHGDSLAPRTISCDPHTAVGYLMPCAPALPDCGAALLHELPPICPGGTRAMPHWSPLRWSQKNSIKYELVPLMETGTWPSWFSTLVSMTPFIRPQCTHTCEYLRVSPSSPHLTCAPDSSFPSPICVLVCPLWAPYCRVSRKHVRRVYSMESPNAA